jgi:lincosamide nucleotidyltransferase A/C/D/E
MARRNAQAVYFRVSTSPRCRRLYFRLVRSSAAALLELRPVRLVKGRFQRRMQAADVLEILDGLQAAQVRVWVVGGWAVDALLGEQTREHVDLDLLLDFADEARGQAVLEDLGFWRIGKIERDFVPDGLMPRRIPMRDDWARMVELHAADLQTWPRGWFEKLEREGRLSYAIDPADAFAEGMIDGRTVRCLSPGLQVASRQVYDPTEADQQDVARLCARFDLPLPSDLEAPIPSDRTDALTGIG